MPVGYAMALIKWVKWRECEYPLRVNRESAYAGSNCTRPVFETRNMADMSEPITECKPLI